MDTFSSLFIPNLLVDSSSHITLNIMYCICWWHSNYYLQLELLIHISNCSLPQLVSCPSLPTLASSPFLKHYRQAPTSGPLLLISGKKTKCSEDLSPKYLYSLLLYFFQVFPQLLLFQWDIWLFLPPYLNFNPSFPPFSFPIYTSAFLLYIFSLAFILSNIIHASYLLIIDHLQ